MSNGAHRLEALWHLGKKFLGTETAILAGAMTWVSERNLVAAISNAGGFGVIASGSMSPDFLKAEIEATQVLTTQPFGVNLITMHPQLGALIEVCIEKKVTHVVLAGGLPKGNDLATLHQAGIKTICFVPAVAFARRLIRQGVGALIIEGSEAGGHIGPISTSVLAQEVLPHVKEVPVFVAGGIGTGQSIVSYLEMGAAGCQLGTRFVCATECQAHPHFKQAFIRANARDAVASAQLDPRFPVIPVRAIANEATSDFMECQRRTIERYEHGELDMPSAQLEIEHFWAGALRRAVIEGDVQNGSVMAGQSVGLVKKEQPAREIIAELVAGAIHVLDNRPYYESKMPA